VIGHAQRTTNHERTKEPHLRGNWTGFVFVSQMAGVSPSMPEYPLELARDNLSRGHSPTVQWREDRVWIRPPNAYLGSRVCQQISRSRQPESGIALV
jgi:hypothetical protein